MTGTDRALAKRVENEGRDREAVRLEHSPASASVSRIATESGSGLENTDESDVTKLPLVWKPIDRTFTADRPLSDITIDLPTTAIVPVSGTVRLEPQPAERFRR